MPIGTATIRRLAGSLQGRPGSAAWVDGATVTMFGGLSAPPLPARLPGGATRDEQRDRAMRFLIIRHEGVQRFARLEGHVARR
jgi:hypothetical protein